MNIRLLKSDEIDVRVQIIKENGFSLLLYKDARVDMAILDETFGVFGWERKHELIDGGLYCTIGIYDKDTQQWVFKQDIGVESYTEKEKGRASDSFKRAAFNIGIGRELYTAPFIWIVNTGDVGKNDKGKLYVSTSFKVSEIGYNDKREINHLVIVDNKGEERYRLDSYTKTQAPPEAPKAQTSSPQPTGGVVKFYCSQDGVEISENVAKYSKEKYGRALCMNCQAKEKK